MVRMGIIGTGIIARAHVEGILLEEGLTLAAVCDVKEEAMELFLEETGQKGCQRYTDYRQLLASGCVDAVIVCTPNVSHSGISLAAAAHGVHVLCEKPMAMDMAEAGKMLEAAQNAGIVHMVGFAFRYIPAVSYIKELVDSGRLGSIHHFRGRFFANRLAPEDHPLEWRHREELAGSGVIGDLVSHILDMAHYLVLDYDKVEKLSVQGQVVVPRRRDPSTGRMAEVTTEETVSVYMRAEDRMEVTLEGSRYSPFEMGFQLTGSKGSVRYDMMRYQELEVLFYEREGAYSQKYSQEYERIGIPERWMAPEKQSGRFIRQVQEFAACIREGRKPACSFEEGFQNQRMLDKIKEICLVSSRPQDVS